jgi:hypothetical protein
MAIGSILTANLGELFNVSAWKEYKAKLGEARPWDVLNPNVVQSSDVEATRRFSICEECPRLIKSTKQCKECGCFMKLKVKVQSAACPIGKW